MSLSDPIADALTRIRNASRVNKETVDIPSSRLTERILDIFKDNGYIEDFKPMKTTVQGTFKVYFKNSGKKSAIIGIRRISRPGLRIYVKEDRIPRVLNGMGTAVISTSRGVVSDREARKMKIGGEVLCYIW